ncbi:MAG: hypothetical protein IQL11_02265 [Bacteroidales bacterium]|nr:hypothetical protein [Bacteroidales bacterium]
MKQLISLLKKPVSVIVLFLPVSVSAGNIYHLPAGAAEAGMGSVCVMQTGFWSSFQNQASLAFNNYLSAGINYENRFSLKELGTRIAGIIIPAGNASLGMIYSHFGYSCYRREMAGLGCGLLLSENLAAGIQIDYFTEKTPGEYGNHQAVICEAGLLVTPRENIRIGVHIFNPVPNSLRKVFMPVTIRTGVGIELDKGLFAGAEAEMSSGRRLVFKTGFDYEAVKNFRIRGGFCTENNAFSFGLGYTVKFLNLDLSFTTHEKLGITSCASMIFKIL